MMCQGGRCACQASGRSCQETAECCSGLTCQSNVCRPMADAGSDVPGDRTDATVDLPRVDVPGGDTGGDVGDVPRDGDGGMCIAAGRTCMAGQTCCGDYQCGMQPGGVSTCCHNTGGSCMTQTDCCGWQLCMNGRCSCRAREATCITDQDCCNGLRCNRPMGQTSGMGTCACRQQLESCTNNESCCTGLECRSGRCLVPGCTAPGENCGMGDAGLCCGGYECGIQPGGISRKCCRPPALTMMETQTPCMNNLECCGMSLCEGGFCRCRTNGQSCLRDVDCCGRMLCNRPPGTPSTQPGTCACQMRGQLCLTGGQDCCSGLTCRDGTCQ